METDNRLRKKSSDQRTFLSRWVNLSGDADELDAFWAAYKTWFREGAFGLAGIWETQADLVWKGAAATPDLMKDGRNKALLEVRNDMRKAWETSGIPERQWRLHPLRYK